MSGRFATPSAEGGARTARSKKKQGAILLSSEPLTGIGLPLLADAGNADGDELFDHESRPQDYCQELEDRLALAQNSAGST
jgi:hypothetical protein